MGFVFFIGQEATQNFLFHAPLRAGLRRKEGFLP